jgi:hypothetical protein
MFATMQILRTADEHFTDLPEFPMPQSIATSLIKTAAH